MTDWPEEDWERRSPYLCVNVEEIAELLRDFGDLHALDLFEEGKSNTNYLCSFLDGPQSEGRGAQASRPRPGVVLRLYERDESALQRETLIHELVRDSVPVPRLLMSGALSTGTPFGVFELLEGRKPSAILQSHPTSASAVGRAVGRTLAALSRFEYSTCGLFSCDLGFERPFESVAESLVDLVEWSLSQGRAGKRLGPDLTRQLAAALPHVARRLEGLDERYTLVHGDYKFSNLLIATQSHDVSGVLDWEFALAFTPLFDVAILMRHRATFPSPFVDGFSAGFTEGGGVLPEDWRELTRILDLMNLCGFLNASGDRPRVYGAATSLIRETLTLVR